ncbi:MAG: septum formation inhibitor Maf [Nitrospirae bacterium]|nr:septum formation inhibitor Maf [Nitrospirota bacterium]
MKPLILASASPRRRELIARLGVPFTVSPADIDESMLPGENADAFARRIAQEKALKIAASVDSGIVVGVDTIVALDGEVMGKPESPEVATAMLAKLSGRTHEVISGVAVIERPSGRTIVTSAVTDVRFKTLTSREIDRYVASGEPLDKAGAYGIQGIASLFVEGISGCYYNVVGLPLNLLYETLLALGVEPAF